MDQIELLALLEELAPSALATPWDNSGLQVTAFPKKIKHIAVSLDASTESVQKALNLGADFIFTHHPLKLSPSYPNKLDTYHTILSLLFKHDIPLYSAHTTLDSMPVAAWLADELNLIDREFLEETGVIPYTPHKDDATENSIVHIQHTLDELHSKLADVNEYLAHLSDAKMLHSQVAPKHTNHEQKKGHTSHKKAGIGIVASFKIPQTKEEFLHAIKTLIPHTHPFSLVGKLPEKIMRIAICPGSGSSLLTEAKKLGAQVFITGDIKYHVALDFLDTLHLAHEHENAHELPNVAPTLSTALEYQNLHSQALQCLIDVGHFSLEEEMMRRFSLILQEKVQQKDKNLRVTFIQSHDPFALIKE